MTTYRAVYEREPDGSAWNVRFPEAPGCFTWGRSLGQAKSRAREALACHLDVDPAAVHVTDDVVAGEVTDLMHRALEVRAQAARAQADAKEITAAAAKALVGAGFTRRDAAVALGLSHQRIDQLV